jgi:O-antigen ligase
VIAVATALLTVPMLKPAGPGHITPADTFMGIAIVIVLLWLGTTGVRAHLPYIVPMSLFIGAGMLSAAVGAFPERGAITIGQDIALLAWAACVANVVRTPDGLRTIMKAWVYSATVWGAALVVAMVTHQWWLAGGPSQVQRGSLFFVIPNIAGNYFVLAFFVLLLGNSPSSFLPRLAVGATLLAATAVTGSNAAIGSLVIGGSISLFIWIWRRWDLVTAIGSIFVGIVVVFVLSWSLLEIGAIHWLRTTTNSLVVHSVDRSFKSAQGRQKLFPEVFELYRDGTPLGIGPAATLPTLASRRIIEKSAHDDYLATLVERGPVGLIGLVILIVGVFVRCWTLALGKISAAYQHVVRNPTALIGIFITIWVTAMTHEVLHYRHVWAFFGLLAGLYLFARAPSDRAASKPTTGRATDRTAPALVAPVP